MIMAHSQQLDRCRLVLVAALLVLFCPCQVLSQPAHPSNPLRRLAALRKPHFSWPTPNNASDPVLLDYARITHSLSISGAWATQPGVHEVVAACHASDLLPPPGASTLDTAAAAVAPRCSIAINYSPWSEDRSPFPTTAPPTQQGRLEDAELQYFRERIGNISAWVRWVGWREERAVAVVHATLDAACTGCLHF